MNTYHVEATREGRYWVLAIEGVGVTQARHLAEVEHMVADYIRLDRGPEAVKDLLLTVNITVAGLEDEVAAVREEVQEAIDAQARAAARSRAVARKLKDAGLTGADTARVMGVSPQRVSQLTAEDREHANA